MTRDRDRLDVARRSEGWNIQQAANEARKRTIAEPSAKFLESFGRYAHLTDAEIDRILGEDDDPAG